MICSSSKIVFIRVVIPPKVGSFKQIDSTDNFPKENL